MHTADKMRWLSKMSKKGNRSHESEDINKIRKKEREQQRLRNGPLLFHMILYVHNTGGDMKKFFFCLEIFAQFIKLKVFH